MSKDLFDESTMTFGEHLEALRFHLFRALIGLLVGVTIGFFISKDVLVIIQQPITNAMKEFFRDPDDKEALLNAPSAWQQVQAWWNGKKAVADAPAADIPDGDKPSATDGTAGEKPTPPAATDKPDATDGKSEADGDAKPRTNAEKQKEEVPNSEFRPRLQMEFDLKDIADELHQAYPKTFPALPSDAKSKIIKLRMTQRSQYEIEELINAQNAQARTDSVDEAFMIYLKVSLLVGAVIASPYIFYQLWLFIAAGLYPHERKYVYVYLPLSLFLFLGGCAFAFYLVIPQVLTFLFGFNKWMNLRPEMKIGSWLSFVTIVPLMFGVSFQLPMVMVFLSRINLLTVQLYRTYRRHSILVIAVISMVFTPSDPVSMIMMMVPLVLLYEFGILLSGRKPAAKSPFEARTA